MDHYFLIHDGYHDPDSPFLDDHYFPQLFLFDAIGLINIIDFHCRMIQPFEVLARNCCHSNHNCNPDHQLYFLVDLHCRRSYWLGYDQEWNFSQDVLYLCYQIPIDLGYLHWLFFYFKYELTTSFHPGERHPTIVS